MCESTTTATETIRVERFYPHARARVWRALTEPDLLARWWAAGDIAPIVGHVFELDMGRWGLVECTVLDVEPETLLRFSFDKWTIAWRLADEGAGTRLYLEQHGLDPQHAKDRFAIENMGPGWRDDVLPALEKVLEEHTS